MAYLQGFPEDGLNELKSHRPDYFSLRIPNSLDSPIISRRNFFMTIDFAVDSGGAL